MKGIYLGKESNWGNKQKVTVEKNGEGLKFSNGIELQDYHSQD